ncbi:MAG: PhoH family protein [Gammaproteobacteria bacterium]|jgi:phosphate starvation-inducible PhoH-like protein
MSRKNGRLKDKHKYYIDYLTEDPKVIELQANTPPFNTQQKPSNSPKPIQAKNQSQGQFMTAIRSNTLVFGLGPAGTGKSYCTAALAAEALVAGNIDRIIFTRPAVETGKSLGFLPGKLEDKFDPYFSAFKSCLISNAGKGVVECAVKNGNIVVEPLAYMRGKTFNRCFVILDEAQNCTSEEIKMFMTRIGRNSTVVINGDLSQTDLDSCSGLHDAINRVHDVQGVYVHEFTYEDIVRSDIVKDIIMKYEVINPPGYRFCNSFA